MPTFTFEGANRIYIGAQAQLVVPDREIASEWAQKHIKINPSNAWVLGRFVEADRANRNNQYFSLDSLRFGNPSIAHAPMNINHSGGAVGAFVASDLQYPEDGDDLNAYIESLGVLWKYYFPEAYEAVKAADESGQLFYSMECVPRAISTVGGEDDSVEYSYDGRTSPTYPDEINERLVPMNLIDPHFVGGALVIPPARPGWGRADTTQIADFMKQNWREAEAAYASIGEALPDAEVTLWESIMNEMILLESTKS